MPDIQIEIDQSAPFIQIISKHNFARFDRGWRFSFEVRTCLISSWDENLIFRHASNMPANSASFQNWFLGGSKLSYNHDCLISVIDMLNRVCVQKNKKAQRKWARYKNDFRWIKIQNCQIHKKSPTWESLSQPSLLQMRSWFQWWQNLYLNEMFEILLMKRSAESDSNIFCHNHWLPTSIYSLMPQKPIAPLTSVFSLGMKRCRVNFDCTEPCWCLKLDCYHEIRYKHSETYLPRTVFDEQFNLKTFFMSHFIFDTCHKCNSTLGSKDYY